MNKVVIKYDQEYQTPKVGVPEDEHTYHKCNHSHDKPEQTQKEKLKVKAKKAALIKRFSTKKLLLNPNMKTT